MQTELVVLFALWRTWLTQAEMQAAGETELVVLFALWRTWLTQAEMQAAGLIAIWLTAGMTDDAVSLDGYTIARRDRDDGGVALYINAFSFVTLDLPRDDNFEHVWVKIRVNKISFTIGVVYRPPSTSLPAFFESFENLLGSLILDTQEIVILGDFNINLLHPNDSFSLSFSSMCDSLGIKQIINEPTHATKTSSSLIDFILLFSSTPVRASDVKHDLVLSKHDLIFVQLDVPVPVCEPCYRKFRNFRNFCADDFDNDLRAIPWHIIYTLNDLNHKLDAFNKFVEDLFDLHAPYKTAWKPKAPWLTDNIRYVISLRERALRDAKRKRTRSALDYYKQLLNYITAAIRREKRAYLQFTFRNSNSSNLWRTLKQLNISASSNRANIPHHLANVDDINNHFVSAMSQATVDLDLMRFYTSRVTTSPRFAFTLVKVDEVMAVLSSIKSTR
ncbi:hypothetical protein QE152_g22579 [Popillia japonica]|uniref:Endonuclease/exonuclease/phosphatase domain-containing protein n=1 Tax=Popillia japonica TaxID=7064 RepID=A0AAW1KJY7_POPJA